VGAEGGEGTVKPRLLDLFCGAGGAAVGYSRAGFDVVGVDRAWQPYYPFRFCWADALEYLRELGPSVRDRFDALHASPPCQRYSEGGRRYPQVQAEHPDLIAPTRALLVETGLPYVIENVNGALRELRDPVRICARAVGLPRMARHRLFETNWPLTTPACACSTKSSVTIGVYGDRPDGRELNTWYPGSARAPRSLAEAQEAMGMDWADWVGTKEAIPPAYTDLIGRQLLAHLARVQAAAA
jgi:DNA (cytosine-5)-methyltransferase 1